MADFVKLSDLNYALHGELSFSTVGAINKKAAKLLSFTKEIIVDFEKLQYCDSAGIALIVQWQKLAKHNKIYIKFINITSQMQNLINLMGLNNVLFEPSK